MRNIMALLNAEAKLLKDCLAHHTSWLRRQRAAAIAAVQTQALAPAGAVGTSGAATGGVATVTAAWQANKEGPPAGAFSHKEAVDAWHNLLLEVIHNGNYYLLQARSAACVLLPGVAAHAAFVSAFASSCSWRHAAEEGPCRPISLAAAT